MLSHTEQKIAIQQQKTYLEDDFFDLIRQPKQLDDQTIRAKVIAEIKEGMHVFHPSNRPVFDVDPQNRFYSKETRIYHLAGLLGLHKEQQSIINWAIKAMQATIPSVQASIEYPDPLLMSQYLSQMIHFNHCYDIQDLFIEDLRVIARQQSKIMAHQLEKMSSSAQIARTYQFIMLLKTLQMHQDPALERVMSAWVTQIILHIPDCYLIHLYLNLLETFNLPLDHNESSTILLMLERIDFQKMNPLHYCDMINQLNTMNLLKDKDILAFVLDNPIRPDQPCYQDYPLFIRQEWTKEFRFDHSFDDYLNKIPRQIVSLEDTLTKNALKNPRGTHLSIFPILPVLPHNQGTFTSIKKTLADLKASLPILKRMHQAEPISEDEQAILLRIPALFNDQRIREYPYVKQGVAEKMSVLR